MPTKLIKLIEAFNKGPISNPDDDSNLSGEPFLEATDTATHNKVVAIEAAAQEALLNGGTADSDALQKLNSAGIKVYEVGDPQDPYNCGIVMETQHGKIRIETVPGS